MSGAPPPDPKATTRLSLDALNALVQAAERVAGAGDGVENVSAAVLEGDADVAFVDAEAVTFLDPVAAAAAADEEEARATAARDRAIAAELAAEEAEAAKNAVDVELDLDDPDFELAR